MIKRFLIHILSGYKPIPSDFWSVNISRRMFHVSASPLQGFPFPAPFIFFAAPSILMISLWEGMPNPQSRNLDSYTSVHLLSCPSHPTFLTEQNLCERLCLTLEFFLAFLSLISRLFLPFSSLPLLLTDMRVKGNHHHHYISIWLSSVFWYENNI